MFSGIRRLVFRVELAVAVVLLWTSAVAFASMPQQGDGPSPSPTHYIRTLGPYSVDGETFSVKLSVICYKETKHEGKCTEDDEETVKSVKIEDEAGKSRFQKSFPVAFAHQVERHVVEVTRLEGRDHQALELRYEKLPSRANSGESVQLFGVRDGTLQALNQDPFDVVGELGDLPAGLSEDSRRLLAGDILPVYLLTNYFYIVQPIHLKWDEFVLEPQETGEFQVAQQSRYSRKPDIGADAHIHLYASPDKNSTPVGVNVTPSSNVQVLSALFSQGPAEDHSSADETWLKISIDGKLGWIVGLGDYTAIGLTAAH